ncbi:DUF4494 domain-containing protein [Fibrella sp. ES10-3-2-2]|nr:hypothetical protein A6C57_23545 [Fibrella sp. ES10-3-2-2]
MWIESKIAYTMLVENEPKPITESYLHQAISFADAEGQLYEHLKKRITELEVKALKRVPIGQTDVLFFAFQEGDSFWKVKTKYQTETFTGKAKTEYETFIVPALNDREASDRVKGHLKGSLVEREIVNIDVTTILAVYMPNNQIWEGDWLNRMDDLEAQGKKSATSNQTSIEFPDRKADANDGDIDATEKPRKGKAKETPVSHRKPAPQGGWQTPNPVF